MKQLKCVILDDDNYFSYKAQFTALLCVFKIVDYIEGKVAIGKGTTAEQWDQLILSWIFAAISPSILPQLASLTTSTGVWDTLNQLYSSDSEARLLHMRFQLQRIRNGNMSMTDYLKKISVAKEKLAGASEKLHDSQVILIVLGGLGLEYQPFVTSITTRFDHSMTFSSFQHLLMDHDLQFSVQRQTAVPFEAHATVRSDVKSDD